MFKLQQRGQVNMQRIYLSKGKNHNAERIYSLQVNVHMNKIRTSKSELQITIEGFVAYLFSSYACLFKD